MSAIVRKPIPRRADFADEASYNEAAWAEAITHRPLVILRAKHFCSTAGWRGVAAKESLDDLIDEGMIGVRHAVDKYDAHRCSWSTYAGLWIDHYIRLYLMKQVRPFRIPYHALANAFAVLRGRLTLDDFPPRRRKCVQHTTEIMVGAVYTNQTRYGADCLREIEDDPDRIDEQMDHEVLWPKVIEALAALSERDQMLLRRRFGLDDGRRQTYAEIGATMGLTKQRIYQIQKQAIHSIHCTLNQSLAGVA